MMYALMNITMMMIMMIRIDIIMTLMIMMIKIMKVMIVALDLVKSLRLDSTSISAHSTVSVAFVVPLSQACHS